MIVGDIGVNIDVTVLEDGSAKDISAATTRQVIIYPPTGNTQTFSASFVTDGTDGALRYTTTASTELPVEGEYQIQARVADSGPVTFDYRTTISTFEVGRAL